MPEPASKNIRIFSIRALMFLMGCLVLLSALSFGGYICWNTANPERICASCHEIGGSVSSFQGSAHRDLACSACHGTALSAGFHSLQEKANMVLTHLEQAPRNEDIRMTEAQVLQVSNACAKCHQSEYAKWRVGDHAATYADIFLDEEHNAMEAPYPDCLRCHGMYYDDNINALMEPLDTTGPWRLKQPDKEDDPSIPCLACHQMHSENEVLTESDDVRNPTISLYSRADKMHLRADKLLKSEMLHNGKPLKVSDDHAQRLCTHCHSPNYQHEAGTEDDRTPTGVHEGLSCNACHEPHSNNAANSCVKCHPATSNCNLDVRTMDTTFANPDSPNNVHFVSCGDCHAELEQLPTQNPIAKLRETQMTLRKKKHQSIIPAD